MRALLDMNHFGIFLFSHPEESDPLREKRLKFLVKMVDVRTKCLQVTILLVYEPFIRVSLSKSRVCIHLPRPNTCNVANECNDKISFQKFQDLDGDRDHHQNFQEFL